MDIQVCCRAFCVGSFFVRLRNEMRFFARGAVIAGALAAAGFATAAQAQVCDGTERRLGIGAHRIDMRAGDVLTHSVVGTPIRLIQIDRVPISPNIQISSAGYTAPRDAEYMFFQGDGRGLTIRCGRPAVSATTGETVETRRMRRALISHEIITEQTNVVQTAVTTNIIARFGGVGVSATGSNVFVSSQGLDRAQSQFERPELNAWASVEARRLSGATTGQSRNLTLGMDRLVTSDILLGGFVSIADRKTTANATTTDVRAPMIGAYGARRYAQGFLSAHLGFGRPEYHSTNGNFTANRTMLAVNYDANLAMGAVRLMPAVGVSASREDLPASGALAADRIENLQARLALRVEPLARYGNGVLPYLSLAAEHGRQSSRAAADQSFTKPRLGLGFDWTRGAGVLRLDLDRGNLSANTRDTGLRLSYDWSF